MALSPRKPAGYPEISFLSFDVLELLATIPQEMGLFGIGPMTFSLQPIPTLACVRCIPGQPGGDIYMHSLFNRADVPQPVIEHILRHELLHLKIPPREVDGKLINHPPEFWQEEQALVPWKSDSWAWIYEAFWDVIKVDRANESVRVKKTWRRRMLYPYPTWESMHNSHNRVEGKQEEITGLMQGL